ncbi:ABC transporter permease [Streptomyces sp. NPDC058457]|uniref:ABC transporter permease n=1 Tax=Streptomyces sp. NPDC058457 TaxID=3346507 RepID=UPI003668AE9C
MSAGTATQDVASRSATEVGRSEGLVRATLRDRQVRVGLAVTLAITLVALVGPYLAPHAAEALTGPAYAAPGSSGLLGTDYLGHDVLSRVLSGGRSVVTMTVAAASLALVAGTALGAAAAFSGALGASRAGRAPDRAVVWLADVLLAFPNVVLVLLVVSMFGRERWLMVLTVALTLLSGTVRLARGAALGVITQEYVQAARLIGYPKRLLLLREVLPNIAAPLLVHFGTMLTWAVELLAGLGFLGYGVSAPAADWGLMINENRAGLQLQPWGVLAPVLLIAVFALGTNAMAEGAARATGQTRRPERAPWRRPRRANGKNRKEGTP